MGCSGIRHGALAVQSLGTVSTELAPGYKVVPAEDPAIRGRSETPNDDLPRGIDDHCLKWLRLSRATNPVANSIFEELYPG